MSNAGLDFKGSQAIKRYPQKTYMMDTEPPYAVCGCSQFVEDKGTHVIINLEQMVRACKDPLVEGPKIVLECVDAGRGPKEASPQEMAAKIRRLQSALDKNKMEEEKAAEEEQPSETDLPEPVQVESGNSTVDALIKMLENYNGAADVKAYAKDTLGMTSADFPGNPSKEKCIEAVRSHMLNK